MALTVANSHTRSFGSRIDFKQIWALIKAAASSWSDDYAPSMGAALSYYTLFSIAPLLLIVISVAGLVFGQEAARGEIFGQLNGFMGSEAAAAIQGLLESVNKPAEGTLGTVVGIVLVLIGATTVFGELQDAMDRIWRAPARAQSNGLWALLRARLLSFGMILSIGFLLMVSLVMGAVLSAFSRWWSPFLAGWETVAQVINTLFSFGITMLAFAMIYKIMPRVKIAWRDVWIGAAVTAFLFTVGKFLIGLYIGRSGVVSGFGAASSIVIVLIWVYYSAQIFLVGAEFTWVYAHIYGSRKGQKIPKANEAPTVRNEKELSVVDGSAQTVSAERNGRTRRAFKSAELKENNMNHSHPTPKNMQASEREDDFLPRDQAPCHNLHEPQSMISTIDPITGNDVGHVQGKPSLVDGNLTIYFESEQTRQAYLDEQKNHTA